MKIYNPNSKHLTKEKKMDLKEFITATLIDIVEGIEEAKLKLGTKICPPMGQAYINKFDIKLNNFNGMYYQQAEFDVAITAENKTDGGTKAGIKVAAVIEAHMGGNISSNNSRVSRVKFHVPLGLPCKKLTE